MKATLAQMIEAVASIKQEIVAYNNAIYCLEVNAESKNEYAKPIWCLRRRIEELEIERDKFLKIEVTYGEVEEPTDD